MKTTFVYLILIINLSLDFSHSQNQDCIVPAAVSNAKWVLNGTQKEISPGTSVQDKTEIRTICNSNFYLIYGTNDFTKCESGNWTPFDPICLALSDKSKCREMGYCILPAHPDSGKWVNTKTGQELTPGSCSKRNVSVTASCGENYNYFGDTKFSLECNHGGFSVADFYCTDKNPEGYMSTKDCIIPKSPLNTKWVSAESDILAGEYGRNGTIIRSICLQNFTFARGPIKVSFACVLGKWRDHGWFGEYRYPVLWSYIEDARCQEIYADQISNGSGCLIPESPDNGVWSTWDTKVSLVPGKYAQTRTKMILMCNKQHKQFSATNSATCLSGGVWKNIDFFGVCEPMCEPLYSTDQFKVICTSDNKISENCTEPLDGTVAEIACKPTFQNLRIWESKSKLRVCLRGRWNNNVLPNCIPKTKCGLKAPNLRPLIVNGTDVSSGGYPWHVALYKIKNEKRKYNCGGSLISDRLIITAAHCVTYQSGQSLPVGTLEVSVGKQFSSYSDPRDKHSQSSTIIKMFIPETYKGDSKNFIGDIAILVARQAFNLRDTVLPVCVNFGTDKLEEKLLTDHKKLGYVPGFGVTETGNISEALKEIGVPLIEHENCSRFLPEEFIEYYSYDKFCAGHLNQSTSVCNGDSGGGLVVQNPLDNRFYLAGVVSVTPLDQVGPLTCNIQQYTLFTNVAEYVDFISDKGGEYLQTKLSQSAAAREFQNYVKWFPLLPKFITPDMVKGKSNPGFPYLTLIGTKVNNENHWFCSGNLISDRFILTAATCTSNRSSPLIVRLGIDTTQNATNFQVVQIHVSPDYRPLQVYNDIALMKLSEIVEFSDSIHPALLYTNKALKQPESLSRSATWSKTAEKRADVYLLTQTARTCVNYFKRYTGDDFAEGFVNDVQICAKPADFPIQTVPDLCDLLPGGSLPFNEVDHESNRNYDRIAAITTTVKNCQDVKGFVLFTKISPFVPWIEGIVWPPN